MLGLVADIFSLESCVRSSTPSVWRRTPCWSSGGTVTMTSLRSAYERHVDRLRTTDVTADYAGNAAAAFAPGLLAGGGVHGPGSPTVGCGEVLT